MFYGCPHALRDYLLNKKIENIVFIGLPLLEQRKSSITIYKKKTISEKRINQGHYGVLGYVFDIFLTIYWIIKLREKYDIFVGVNVLNSLSGIILKKLGIVNKVIFYAMDFPPIRFKNPLLNYIYHAMEIFCVKRSDEIWNVSPKIAQGREKFLNLSRKKYPQKVVPSGVWYKKIKKYPFEKVKKHQLLFLGHLLEKQGLQMVISSIPVIIKKIPDFKFVILGGGEYESELKKLARKLKIEKYIEFKGWTKNREQIDTTLGESAAAVAVYVPEKEKLYNFSYYGDPIKIKEYLASGLPVILTDVPYNAKDIASKKCGILVNYTKEEIVEAIIHLLGNEKILKEFKMNAFNYAKNFDWNIIFDKALN